MTKKILLMAAALLVTVPMALAQDTGCASATPNLKVVAVGSSAQFNATAFAAQAIINGESGSQFNLFSAKGKDTSGNGLANLIDSRVTTGLFPDPADSATLWVAWDALVPCNVWVYFSVDSAVGVKDFLAYAKIGTKSYAAVYGSLSGLEDGHAGAWCGSSCSQNKVFGLSDTDLYNSGDNLPTSIITALNKIPSTDTSVPAFCASGVYCYFNAGVTDIRPEDALFGTTRALSNYDTKELNGIGYNSTGCGGDGLTPSGKVGCPIYSAMGTGSKFYALDFKLSGTDPIASGTLPKYVTYNVGANPLLVIVNNQDTTNVPANNQFGFGATNSGNYVFTNINRYTLSQVFQGHVAYTTSLLPTTTPPVLGCPICVPIQVVFRELLSGTYNAYEFTAVRTLSGSGNPLAASSSTNVTSNAYGGQELGIDPATNNFLTNAADCPTSGFPTGNVQCTDPVWLNIGGISGALRLRSIGTGEEVPGIVNGNSGQSSSKSAAPDGIGYTFWSFGNVKPANPGNGHPGHYLTVDGVDPLFNSPTDGTNLQGAYNIPRCNASNDTPPCSQSIPFTHVQDGSYPLWSILRMMSFASTPAAVTQLISTEINLSNTDTIQDYYPLLNTSGNLQLGVFRAHYKQSSINPNNGYSTCTGYNPPTPSTCLVDAGGDEGGAVLPIALDLTTLKDFGFEVEGVRQ